MSLISRLRAVVAGDDYLDGDYDDLEYDTGEQDDVEEGPSHSIRVHWQLLSHRIPLIVSHRSQGQM